MLELPGTIWRETAWDEREALGAAPVNAAWRRVGGVRHVFTHFELRLEVFAAEAARIEAEGLVAPIAGLPALELSSLMRKCVRVALEQSTGADPARSASYASGNGTAPQAWPRAVGPAGPQR